jgi:predicted permease
MGQALLALLPLNDDALPLALDGSISLRTLLFSILMGALTALLAGAAPALLSARANLNESLKETGRSDSARSHSHRLRSLFVVAEIALATIAIAGAGLFIRSFQGASSIHPGFDVTGIMAADFNLSPAGYTAEEQRDFCVRLREKLEAAPGIAGASYSDVVPLTVGGSPWHQITVEGYTPAQGEDMNLHRSLVPPGYFSLLRIPVLEGRDFTEADDAKAPPVMIVNQAFARRFFAGREPVGRRVRLEGGWRTIVGVVKDTRYFTPIEAPVPYFFVPFRQFFAPGLNFSFFVKANGDPAFAIETLRRHARALNPDAAVYNPMPLAESITMALYPQRVAASLLSVLGALSLLLASVGLYSVMSHSVSQRTAEIGVRMALGAKPADVIAMVARQGMTLLVPGLLLGAAASFALSRLVSSFLYRVGSADPLTYAATILFLAVCTLLACFFPALRATRVNPIEALRAE